MGKKRTPIPRELAARVLFDHDRTCAVCRHEGKPVQIHHLDQNPTNHDVRNLAVLCFDCHRDTQIQGGFDRKLDSDQIVLYREDWLRLVGQRRAAQDARAEARDRTNSHEVGLATSIAEIYRENGQLQLLVYHYDELGNTDLRDKYIELAISEDPSDQTVVSLRALQGQPEMIPKATIQREIERYTKDEDWLQRGRFFCRLRRHEEAISDYLRGILESLKEGNAFSAAFYLRELYDEGLLQELQIMALERAREDGDLWWQVRALEELGWDEELDEFLVQHTEAIEESQNPLLVGRLAAAVGDQARATELRKSVARGMRVAVYGEIEKELPNDT